MKGTVKFYDYGKRFGFIAGADGQDYYFALPEGERINAGCAVEFDAAQNRKGLVAKGVKKHEAVLKGRVRLFRAGQNFGFIAGEDGRDYYFRLPREKWAQVGATVQFRHDPSLPGEAPVAVDVVQISAPELEIAPALVVAAISVLLLGVAPIIGFIGIIMAIVILVTMNAQLHPKRPYQYYRHY